MTTPTVPGTPHTGPYAAPRPAWMARVVDAIAAGLPPYFAEHVPPWGVQRRAGVLMLFGPDPLGGEDVVLTERALTLRSHPGQVSFPGGRIDPGDDGAIDAAIREAEEEVGVDPASVDVVLDLPELYLRPSDNAVTPVLAWWPAPGRVQPVDVGEVAHVARVPVDALVDPANRFTAVVPGGSYRGAGFEVDGLYIWGFTAKLLEALFDVAGLAQPWDESRERPIPDRLISAWRRGSG